MSEVWVSRSYRYSRGIIIARYLLLFGLLVGASVGSGIAQTATPTPGPVVQDADASKYEGWKRVAGKNFSFYGPSDLEGGQKRGIDTAVYRYQDKQFRIFFDIGAMANPAPLKPTKEVVVDGRDAQIVHRPGQSDFHVRLGEHSEFNMYVAYDNPELWEVAEKMCMSLRFTVTSTPAKED